MTVRRRYAPERLLRRPALTVLVATFVEMGLVKEALLSCADALKHSATSTRAQALSVLLAPELIRDPSLDGLRALLFPL